MTEGFLSEVVVHRLEEARPTCRDLGFPDLWLLELEMEDLKTDGIPSLTLTHLDPEN